MRRMPDPLPSMPPAPPAEARPLQIFRPGRHTAMAGQALSFSEADLAATAAAYDPALHEAPIVVGHPRDNAPAYGWIRALSASAAGLEAQPQQVDPAFAELVQAGRFKKISASFYAPDSPANPVPGVYYLRHVGFLGAQPPAVKGLREPSFAADEQGVVEFGDAWDEATVARLMRNLREWLLAKFDAATADQVVPQYEVAGLERAANEAINKEMGLGPDGEPAVPVSAPRADFGESPAPSPQPAETSVTPEQAAALQAENERLKAQLEAGAKAARQARHAEHVAFAETVHLPAARRPVVVALLDHLAEAQAEAGKPVEFGEGDARKPLALEVRALLASLSAPVEFGEVATHGRAADPAAHDGAAAGLSNDQVARRARELRARAEERGEVLSYGEAVDAVHREAAGAKAGPSA